MEEQLIYKEILEKLNKGILIICENSVCFINEIAKKILPFQNYNNIPFEILPHQLKKIINNSKELENTEITINEKTIEIELYVIYNGKKKYTITTLKDISIKKNSEILKNRENKFATLGELSLSIAHEIRNPLNIIRGFAQLIDESNDVEFIKENIKIIIQETDSLVNLANFLLKYGKDENIKEDKIEIASFLEKILVRLKIENIVNIEFGKEDIYIYGDKEKLTQVALNIIKNGLESIENCEQKIFNIKIYKKNKYIIISFENSGKFEKNQNLKNLFIPFFTTKSEGVGLGLAISKKIIEKHIGKIYAVKNRYGGLTFKIIFINK
ncbi:MAG: hypothetical protein GX287_07790 [Fusobacteria bacterium]|nr:hypothetical protein [Fusobacteriota bacterium]